MKVPNQRPEGPSREPPEQTWRKVVTSAPIDRIARRVTLPGERFESRKVIQTNDSDLPIATRRPTRQERALPEFLDLTGTKQGRLLVLGQHAEKQGLWVVRCDCGIYTTRRSKALKNPKNNGDRCESCRQTTFLKHQMARQALPGKEGL